VGSAYRFCELLGHGGMGEVYLAVQHGFGGFEKLIVVKRMAPYSRRDDLLTTLFAREARLAACIRHPNVVGVLDIQRTGRELFIMMDYIAGLTFREVLEGEVVPVSVACKALADVAAGLDAGHHAVVQGKPQTIVHGDVSPPNLMLGFDGNGTVLDFGIAQVVKSQDEPDATAMCKMAYVAPEQIEGSFVGPSTDAWQLGIVAHEMLTGTHPFPLEPGRWDAVRRGPASSLRTIRSDVPTELDAFVQRMLDPDPELRPGCDEVHATFEAWTLRTGNERMDGGAAEWMKGRFRKTYLARRDLEARAMANTLDCSQFDYLSRMLDSDRASSLSLDLPPAQPRRRRSGRLATVAIALGLLAGIGLSSAWWGLAPAQSQAEAQLSSNPKGAEPGLGRTDGSYVASEPAAHLPPAQPKPQTVVGSRPVRGPVERPSTPGTRARSPSKAYRSNGPRSGREANVPFPAAAVPASERPQGEHAGEKISAQAQTRAADAEVSSPPDRNRDAFPALPRTDNIDPWAEGSRSGPSR